MPPPEGNIWPLIHQAPFRRVLAAAVDELSQTGFTDPERVQFWVQAIRAAAERDLLSDAEITREIRDKFGATYARFIERGKIAERVPGVSRYTLTNVRPELRAELDRRTLAAADLIKLHRREAVEKTLQRFQGWSTSIPPGGDGAIDKREVRSAIGKSVAQEKFERRRVAIDQGHKLISNIAHIVAADAGAIAGVWHDHGEHDKRYDARKEHLKRSGKIFVIRDSWAHQEGLIKPLHGYMDEIEAPGQLVYCRCFYQYLTAPQRLPDAFLTRKGREWIVENARKVAA